METPKRDGPQKIHVTEAPGVKLPLSNRCQFDTPWKPPRIPIRILREVTPLTTYPPTGEHPGTLSTQTLLELDRLYFKKKVENVDPQLVFEVVIEPTHLKNMLVKLDHFPR